MVGLKKDKKPRQIFVPSIGEIDDHAEAMVTRGYDAYFALGSFIDPQEGRTSANAGQFRSFFIDIDCGEGKPYETQAVGMSALKAFITETQLPKPTIVNSGRGVHAYWTLDEAIPKDEWKRLAEGLKALCARHGLEADPAVTADAARILRIPDTCNFKDPANPLPVKVLVVGKPHSVSTFINILAIDDVEIPGKKPFIRQMDPMTMALMGNYQSKYKTILMKSLQGEGCAQVAWAFKNQEVVDYNNWRAALSVAQFCSDSDIAIHKISEKHPQYDKNYTIKIAQDIVGPYTCQKFKELNPKVCEGCPLKITSPIVIGRHVVEATEADNIVEQLEPITKEIKKYEIPKYPFPFFRGKVGGVYRSGNPEVEGDKDELLFAYDFYVVRRINDPDEGETVWMRLHLPKDGVRDFIVPLKDILAKERFRDALAMHGIAVLGKKQDALMVYVTRWVEELQATAKADQARKQFGWLEDNSAFIIGDREIRVDTVAYSPPSAPTLPLIPVFQPKGDFHIWKDVINAYGRPGMEVRALAFFMGFGGPLMKFVGDGMLSGFLLNLISEQGGSGKTTLLFAINSIYGMPEPLLLSYKDTHNHRLQRLGAMQSMTSTIDELTNMTPEQMSNLVYDITSGRGKNRMSSKANVERHNHTTWKIPVVSSSNKSIKDALLSIKSFPEPELLRMLETPLLPDPYDDPTWSKAHFGRIMHNYGHAADLYVKHILNHLPEVKALVNEVNQRMDRAANIVNTERFWSAGATIAIAGGMIAKNIGLHDIPIEPVFNFTAELIKNSRKSNKESMFDSSDFLGGFLQRHFHEILVINGKVDKRTGLEMGPIREPRGPLTARYEPDTKMLFVSARSYRDDCSKLQANFEKSLEPYTKSKAYIGLRRKRMFAGTVTNMDYNVMALCFDTTKLGFFKEEILLNAQDSESSGEDSMGQVQS